MTIGAKQLTVSRLCARNCRMVVGDVAKHGLSCVRRTKHSIECVVSAAYGIDRTARPVLLKYMQI